jgi:hypothetical protein
VCADPKKDLFVPIPICRVLKHILQFVLFSNKSSYNAAVKSFYAAKGIDFGANTSDIIENVVLGVNSAVPYTFATRSPNCYSQEDTLRIFLFRAPPSSARSLATIPDTGNPKMAAGKPWWDDYSLPLEKAGLLNDVRYSSCSESFGFGDGPSSPPLFVAIQVPLFHRLKTGESLLVFADVKIINHAVDLLEGKDDLQAMQLTSHLRPGLHKSSFSIFGKELCVEDSGFHFFLSLDRPRPLKASEFATSLQQNDAGLLVAVKVLPQSIILCRMFSILTSLQSKFQLVRFRARYFLQISLATEQSLLIGLEPCRLRLMTLKRTCAKEIAMRGCLD